MPLAARATAVVAAVVAALGLTLVSPSVALADEPGESDESRVLVLQAVALVVNTPDDTMAIEERIDDALEAPKTDGVDLGLVEQAAGALEAGDLGRTRDLLQSAIGAGPYVGTGVPEPIRAVSAQGNPPAVGDQAGTAVVLEPFEPDSGLNGGEWVLLALSVLLVLSGAALSWSLRPRHSVRQLRRATASKEA